MPIDTILTLGWPPLNENDPYEAIDIHIQAKQAEDYSQKLGEILFSLRQQTAPSEPIYIKSIERIFRRRVGLFGAIKKFVTVSEYVLNDSFRPIFYEINVFAYAFLKMTKKLDYILKETHTVQEKNTYRQTLLQWQQDMKSLEQFERKGILPKNQEIIEPYLKLRQVVACISNRDERRSLATLLISGPSTAEEIAQDLGMPYGLSGQILPVFEQIGVIESRQEQNLTRYVLVEKNLPQVMFCLRETMGIDLGVTQGLKTG